jgi:adenosylcobinamide amidohydrolase
VDWEILWQTEEVVARRSGRFIVVELRAPHDVLSTSARNGGQTKALKYLVNHQSCEGAAHEERFQLIHEQGEGAYHDSVCRELGFSSAETALMGTAANMNYAALTTKDGGGVRVTAIATAGVHTNATCAGDPATWREQPEEAPGKIAPIPGTINILMLIDRPLTPAALARSAATMTEGKSTALQRLAIPSCYSSDLATGTGTDQFIIAAPAIGRAPLTSASPHTKFGEAIGAAARDSVLEALRWQNGLEASSTRGLFHALKRYGVRQETIFEDLAPLLTASDLALLTKNANAVFFEPMVGAAAYAFASVLDRARYGTLPDSVVGDALIQQAALMAANAAAKPEAWPRFRAKLQALGSRDPKALALHALATGWSDKWLPR